MGIGTNLHNGMYMCESLGGDNLKLESIEIVSIFCDHRMWSSK